MVKVDFDAEFISESQSGFDKLTAYYTNRIDELQNVVREGAKKMLKNLFKDFFERHPKVAIVTWTQYTPYWNDGEECTFGVNDVEWTANPERDYSDHYDWNPKVGNSDAGDMTKEEIDSTKKDGYTLYKSISSAEDTMRLMFGDHVQIVVTPSQIEVVEYEHD